MIEVPQSFREMPRWWHDGTGWLDSLPGLVERQAMHWKLIFDGSLRHGSNALVIPVRRDGEPLILRMTPPGEAFVAEVRALSFWNGRGTVLLEAADPASGAMLLERLDPLVSAEVLPLAEAIPVLGRLMRRLAVAAPWDARRTSDIARQRLDEFEPHWRRLNKPFPATVLAAAQQAGRELTLTTSDLAVNGDLHFGQVLGGTRERWLCVDPLLLAGDIEYDFARILWSRLDEMADDADVLRHFRAAVAHAELDEHRARHWVLFRTVDYWLWGLGYGLTEDPARCARLVRIFLD